MAGLFLSFEGIESEGALLDSVTWYREALAFVTEDPRGATTLHRWTATHGDTIIPGPRGCRAQQIMIGPDGVGAGLFLYTRPAPSKVDPWQGQKKPPGQSAPSVASPGWKYCFGRQPRCVQVA